MAYDQSCHFPSASTSCRPAPGGRNLAARSVCPILSARVSVPPSVQVPVPVLCELVPLLYPTMPARLSIVARPFKSKSDQPSPSINASDSKRQHHQVGPPAPSLPLRPPPFSSLSASTAGPWRRTRKRRTATWPTHSIKVSSKRRRVVDGRAFYAPLLFSPRLRRMPVCFRPPHHLASNKPPSPALHHCVWLFRPRPGPDPC